MRIPFINSAEKADERYILRIPSQEEMELARKVAIMKLTRLGARRIMDVDLRDREETD